MSVAWSNFNFSLPMNEWLWLRLILTGITRSVIFKSLMPARSWCLLSQFPGISCFGNKHPSGPIQLRLCRKLKKNLSIPVSRRVLNKQEPPVLAQKNCYELIFHMGEMQLWVTTLFLTIKRALQLNNVPFVILSWSLLN